MSTIKTQHGLGYQRRTYNRIASRLDKALPLQLVKYGLAGVLSAVLDLFIFYLLAHCFLPCVDTSFGDLRRAQYFMVDKSVAFLIANAFSYWLNSRWVFIPGRHGRITEIGLFLAISMTAYLIGLFISRSLIAYVGVSTHLAAIVCIAVATAINFVCRKLIVFEK